MVLLLVMFFGDHFFRMLQIAPPALFLAAQENKMMVVFAIYFVGNNLANSLMSTGAFEIFYNSALQKFHVSLVPCKSLFSLNETDKLVWSKIAEGRMPTFAELHANMDSVAAAL